MRGIQREGDLFILFNNILIQYTCTYGWCGPLIKYKTPVAEITESSANASALYANNLEQNKLILNLKISLYIYSYDALYIYIYMYFYDALTVNLPLESCGT